VALSGGKDSSSVLYIMNEILKPRRDVTLCAVSIDEGIRGYRSYYLNEAKRLCKMLGVEHHIFSFKDFYGKTLDEKVKEIKIERNPIEEPCSYCGVGRRYLLNKKARELGITKLCMGHNLDDEAQSVIMNFLRGDLLRASRMDATPVLYHEDFVLRIKPLREIPEEEISLYAKIKGLVHEKGKCPYRGGIRLEVRKFLKEMEKKYPGMRFGVLESFDKIVPFIKNSVKGSGIIRKCEKCGEPTSQKICKACEMWRE